MNYRLGDGSLYTLARGCPNLTNLNISGCSAFSENGIEFVGYWRQLESINLGWCYKLGDAGVMSLAYGCPNLNAIDLFQCISVTDESVIALANNCLHLRSLGLCHCHSITDRAMYALARGRVKSKDEEVLGGSVKTQYENLDISYCKALTAPAVQALCDSFPALHTCPSRRSLIMNGCSNLTSVHCACDSQSHRASLPA
ncbi:putative leucine-rich repeat domain superfamily [Helianthus annuus]|nr:putative leucine-rich repeat domain superfamily [Helianthus annuus]